MIWNKWKELFSGNIPLLGSHRNDENEGCEHHYAKDYMEGSTQTWRRELSHLMRDFRKGNEVGEPRKLLLRRSKLQGI